MCTHSRYFFFAFDNEYSLVTCLCHGLKCVCIYLCVWYLEWRHVFKHYGNTSLLTPTRPLWACLPISPFNKGNCDWSSLPHSSGHKVSLTTPALLERQTQLVLQHKVLGCSVGIHDGWRKFRVHIYSNTPHLLVSGWRSPLFRQPTLIWSFWTQN